MLLTLYISNKDYKQSYRVVILRFSYQNFIGQAIYFLEAT